MADETGGTAGTWAVLLREMRGPLVEAMRWKTVLLSEVKRNKDPKAWSGKQITIPVILAPQQGTQMVTESGVVGLAQTIDDVQANIQTAIIEHTISFTTQLMRQSRNTSDTSWAQVVPTKMRMAEDAISRVMNEQMCGDGTGLIANITATATSLTHTVGTTANFYQLYANRVVDVRTRASGADAGQGLARKIASNSPSAGTVLFSTTQTVTGGGSGNIVVTGNNTESIYIQNTGPGTGTWATPATGTGSVGQAMGGIQGAAATTGTFQGLNKATVVQWRGTDGRAGISTTVDPTISVFDGAERQAMIYAGTGPDFYLTDPFVVDKFTQGLTVQAQWNGAAGQLESGWAGVKYRNKLLVPEYDMAPSTAIGVNKDDMGLYALDEGPDWDEYTGDMFQRFSRALPVEAWLVWMVQLGFQRCNTTVKVGALTQAT